MTMLRFNAGKVPLALIPSSFFEAIFNAAYEAGKPMPTKLIYQVGQVLDFGAQKYEPHNWRKGGQWSSVLNSALRHLVLRLMVGERTDPESGLSEAGHLGCNIAFLLEFAHTASGEDDRYRVWWTPGFEGEAEPSLIWVLDALLKFRDGGSVDCLKDAAYELARWVEFQEEPTVPAPPPATDTITLPAKPEHDGGTIKLPFSFPSFDQLRSAALHNLSRH
jgi:hypothetical protein